MSNFTLTAPGAFPADADAASGKMAAPDPFLMVQSPLGVASPSDAWPGAGEATVRPRISLGTVSINSRCDKADVEAIIEKRELWLARRLVATAESGVKF